VRELLSSFLGNTPPDKVQILREAMRKTFADPEFYAEFKKLVGEESTPLLPEELEKAVRQLPWDREVVELFNRLSAQTPCRHDRRLCHFSRVQPLCGPRGAILTKKG
jgi:hypothetical protein